MLENDLSSAASLPQRCIAAVFQQAGRSLELREYDLPTPGAQETLVRINLCTLCGSDLHTLTGKRIEPTPSILGHEIVGEVVRVGDPAPRDLDGQLIRPGDLVTWSICVSCFECDRCRSGMPQKCRHLVKYGHSVATGPGALSGGLAEYILLRKGSSIATLEPDLPAEAACPINCATSTIAAAYRTAGDVTGKRVLVIGAGMLGLTAAAFGKESGAAQVTVCEPNAQRRQLALRFGADETTILDALVSKDSRFDVILECSGSVDAIESSCRLVEIGGRLLLIGSVMPSRPAQIDPVLLVRQWITVAGVHNYAPTDLRRAIEFVRRCHRKYPLAELVETSFALSDINRAIQFCLDQHPIRIAIRPARKPS